MKKPNQAFITALTLLLFFSAPAYGYSFSALYVGDTDDIAVEAFRDYMLGTGWIQEVYKSGHVDPGETPDATKYPYHYHFTNGRNNDGIEAANDSDFIFIGGHGLRNAQFEIFWNKVPQFDKFIGADTHVNTLTFRNKDNLNLSITQLSPPFEVGIEWK